MPLPFSFSTQRHGLDSERPAGSGGAAVMEAVMQQAPGIVTTEPISGSQGAFGMSAPANAARPAAADERSRLAAFILPPAPSPNQRAAPPPQPRHLPFILADTLNLPPPMPMPQAPSAPLLVPLSQSPMDLSAQLDQLRKDIFGIAMSVSAMNDRMDRMDQRPPQAGEAAASAGLATLRSEVESWLETHLNAAVEHCMHRIISRMPAMAAAAAPPPAPGPVPPIPVLPL